jgi:tetratricopeptide (TPR) repeat protein
MNRLSRYCDGVMEAAWLLALITVPLFFNIDSQAPFDAQKIFLFRSIVWIAVSAWLVKIISEGGVRFVNVPRPKTIKELFRIPLVFPVTLLGLSYLVSTLLSITPRISLLGSYERVDGLLTRLSCVLLFVIVAVNLRRREQLERVQTTVGLVSFPIAFYAILQHYGLDPYIWGKVGTGRSISTIGHPIFAAAFLTMALFVILSRLNMSFKAVKPAQGGNLLRIISYALLAGMNLIAIVFTVSRGPLIGLFAGGIFFGLALLSYFHLRKTFIVFTVLAVVAFGILVVLNIPGGPFSSLRDAPIIRSFGHLFDTEAGTGRQRSILWDGMARLVTPHAPMQFPDHTSDALNLLRPIIGYGPETIRFAYEGYYNPEMFIIEARDLTFDRSHNEFWDSLAFYGLLGMLVEYFFFLSITFYSLKWIGYIANSFDRKLYWGLALGGGFVGAILASLFVGVGYLGLGLPFGLLLGAAGILVYRVFNPLPKSALPLWQVVTLVGLFSAIVSHYAELLFGISVAVTFMLLWMFSGLILVVGWVMPLYKGNEAELKDDQPVFENELRQVGINAILVIAVMATLTMDFISAYHSSLGTYTDILSTSLTALPGPAGSTSSGVVWLLLGTMIFSVVLLQLEDDRQIGRKVNLPNLFFTLGIVLLVSVFSWVVRAYHLETSARSFQRLDQPIIQALIWRLSAYYLGLIGVILFWAAALREPGRPVGTASRKPLAFIGYVLIPLIVVVAATMLNLQPALADMLFGRSIAWAGQGQYDAALQMQDRTISLAPTQDFYLATAARIALDYSRSTSNPVQQADLVRRSLSYIEEASRLSPYFVDYLLDAAQAHLQLGLLAQTSAERGTQYLIASSLYSNAVAIKSTRADYWNGWANLLLNMGDYRDAQQKIEKALSIDSTYEPLYYTAGNIFGASAENESSPDLRKQYFEQALNAFQAEAAMLEKAGEDPVPSLMDVARIQETLSLYDQSRLTYLEILKLGVATDQWRVYQKLADLSGKLQDANAQRDYLKQAIGIAPTGEIATLQAELEKLNP